MKSNMPKPRLMRIVNLFLVLIVVFGCMLFAGCIERTGNFYNLEEAYDNGWLTQEDLKSITYYYCAMNLHYHDNDNANFSPKPLQILSESAEYQIRRTYFISELKDYPGTKLKDIKLQGYYGIYGDSFVVCIQNTSRCNEYLDDEEMSIGGVIFYDYSPALIQVWRSN